MDNDIESLLEIAEAEETALQDNDDQDRVHEEGALYEQAEQKERIASLKQDREKRKKYAYWIVRLVVCWLAVVGLLLIAQRILGPLNWFELSDQVLITALGATTASVISIMVVVAKHLFPNPSKS